jgi:hypothetical protein
VDYGGYHYATMDGVAHQSLDNLGCQDNWMNLPYGWEIAPRDTNTTIIASRFCWGTSYLGVVDTSGQGAPAIHTGCIDQPGEVYADASGTVWMGAITTSVYGQDVFFKVGGCPARILIRRPIWGYNGDGHQLGRDFYIFRDHSGGMYYATLDDVDPNQLSPLDGQYPYLELPYGWSIAPENSDTMTIVEEHCFGTDFLILASGNIYNTSCNVHPGARAFNDNADGLDDQLVEFRPHLAAERKARILISRAGTNPFSNLPAGTASHIVEYKGYLYATIHKGAPAGTAEGCDSDWEQVPSGWHMVDRDQEAIDVITQHCWDTHVITLTTGEGFRTGCSNPAGWSVGYGRLLHEFYHVDLYKAATCPVRILIKKPIAGYRRRRRWITHTVDFHDVTYATIDDRNPTGTTYGCQSHLIKMGEGWEVAPQNHDSLEIIRTHCFQSTEIILGDGNAFGPQCSANPGQVLHANMLESIASIPPWYGPMTGTSCQYSVLIRKLGDDYWKKHTSRNIVIHNGREYSALDNTSPESLSAGCQTIFMSWPSGWEPAPINEDSKFVASQHGWGTQVIVIGDITNNLGIMTAATGVAGTEWNSGILESQGTQIRPVTCHMRILAVKREKEIAVRYKEITSSNCAYHGWNEITTAADCLSAVRSVSGNKNFGWSAGMPDGGATTTSQYNSKGCAVYNDADLMFFPMAEGDCSASGFKCICQRTETIEPNNLDGWFALKWAARVVGNSPSGVADPSCGTILTDCKAACDEELTCHSFLFQESTGCCQLKDHCQTESADSDDTLTADGWVTWYKPCPTGVYLQKGTVGDICRGSGWNNDGWPKNQGNVTGDTCKGICDADEACKGYDLRPVTQDVFTCNVYGHSNIMAEADATAGDSTCFKKLRSLTPKQVFTVTYKSNCTGTCAIQGMFLTVNASVPVAQLSSTVSSTGAATEDAVFEKVVVSSSQGSFKLKQRTYYLGADADDNIALTTDKGQALTFISSWTDQDKGLTQLECISRGNKFLIVTGVTGDVIDGDLKLKLEKPATDTALWKQEEIEGHYCWRLQVQKADSTFDHEEFVPGQWGDTFSVGPAVDDTDSKYGFSDSCTRYTIRNQIEKMVGWANCQPQDGATGGYLNTPEYGQFLECQTVMKDWQKELYGTVGDAMQILGVVADASSEESNSTKAQYLVDNSGLEAGTHKDLNMNANLSWNTQRGVVQEVNSNWLSFDLGSIQKIEALKLWNLYDTSSTSDGQTGSADGIASMNIEVSNASSSGFLTIAQGVQLPKAAPSSDGRYYGYKLHAEEYDVPMPFNEGPSVIVEWLPVHAQYVRFLNFTNFNTSTAATSSLSSAHVVVSPVGRGQLLRKAGRAQNILDASDGIAADAATMASEGAGAVARAVGAAAGIAADIAMTGGILAEKGNAEARKKAKATDGNAYGLSEVKFFAEEMQVRVAELGGSCLQVPGCVPISSSAMCQQALATSSFLATLPDASWYSDAACSSATRAYGCLCTASNVDPPEATTEHLCCFNDNVAGIPASRDDWPICKCEKQSTNAQPIQIIHYRGADYATVDDSDPYGNQQGCQAEPMPIPKGWEVAPADSDAKFVLQHYCFNTELVVLGQQSQPQYNGDTYGTACYTKPGDLFQSNTMERTKSNDVIYYKPSTCDQRMLIRKKGWDYTPPSMYHFVTYGVAEPGYRWATLDDVAPDSFINCQRNYVKIPDGWEIAPGTEEAQFVAKTYNWGTNKVVTKQGYAFYTKEPTYGKTPGDVYENYTNILVHDVTNDLYKPKECNSRILIRTIVKSDDDEDKIQSHTYIDYNSARYATMDFENPHATELSGQTKWLRMPIGFELAPNDANSIYIAGRFCWGTETVILADKTAWYTDCNPVHTFANGTQWGISEDKLNITGVWYKPADYIHKSRILIRKPLEDHADTWEQMTNLPPPTPAPNDGDSDAHSLQQETRRIPSPSPDPGNLLQQKTRSRRRNQHAKLQKQPQRIPAIPVRSTNSF